MTNATNTETLTVAQASLRLARSYNQVMRLVFRGELRGRQDQNGRWRISAEDVARLAERELPATA